jgi:peptidoglycan/LPS O-acetylase OafA/YrhL
MRQAGSRYLHLDLARGLAALAVMVYHVREHFSWGELFRGSFLAVDLFFLMSGFVIAHSYQARLLDGSIGASRFILLRCLRLYPLYVYASALGGLYYTSKMLLQAPNAPTFADLLLALPSALLLLPMVAAETWNIGPFPFAPSAWTLFLEFWCAILFAIGLMAFRTRVLVVVAALSWLALVQQVLAHGTADLGWALDNLPGGAARFWFSFSLGVILWRVARRGVRLPLTPPLAALGLAFLFVLVPQGGVGLQLLWITLLFPAFLLVASGSEPRGWIAVSSDHLGRLSYAIYIVHAPVILLLHGALKAVGTEVQAQPALVGTALILAVLGVAALGTYAFDEPFRAWARRALPGMRPAKAALAGPRA